jgi:preprotein translocase subunit SecD
MNNLKLRLIIILGVTLACVWGIIGTSDHPFPTSKADLLANWHSNIRLGLDLSGGSHLVMQVQMQDAFKTEADSVIQRLRDELSKASITFVSMTRSDPATIEEGPSITVNVTGIPVANSAAFRTVVNDDFGVVWNLNVVNQTDYRMTMKPSEALKVEQSTMVQSINTIEKKVNAYGVTESTVQQRRSDEILVQLPGVDDPARIKNLLKTAAVLELDEVQGGPFGSREEAMASKNGILPLGSQIVRSATRGGTQPEFYILARTPVVTGRDIRDANPQQDQNGKWETSFVLAQDAAARFSRFTGAHVNDRLAIVLDHQLLSAPTIQSKISDNGVITNMGGHDEAADLALNLRAGSLPAGVEYIEERTVGPSLGSDSIKAGMLSGIAGVIAVVAIMLFYYKRSGINATLALVLNAVILIACLSYFNAVLTLPGIAGVILTVGMAVDSNVLIFERIREELRTGKAVVAAVDAGFGKAFLTIVDTHVTTVVSCAFLFLFGTGPVKGFAVTLVIGLLANLFTAVFVSRTIFDWELAGKRAVTLSI